MHYREYGTTGKWVSVIGFGGMRFGKDEDAAAQVMVRASELGINYFDTAPNYCHDRSEFIFGKAFARMKTPFYVSTKSSVESEPKADDVRRRIDQALDRMQIDRIHFFHMWCIMDWEQYQRVIAPGGPYEGALKAKAEGLVDHIVFSTHANGAEIRKMCAERLFDGVTLGYNIFNYTNRYDGICAASENNMGVAVMNPLGGGMVSAAASKLGFIVHNPEETVVQAALRFVISHPEVTTALAGMGTVEQVTENAAVGDRLDRPDAELVNQIKATYGELGDVFCTACGYCLPCPQGLIIPEIMFALNYHRVGMIEIGGKYYQFFRKMYQEKWVPAAMCSDCGICETRCTQKLPVREYLREVVKLYESGDSD